MGGRVTTAWERWLQVVGAVVTAGALVGCGGGAQRGEVASTVNDAGSAADAVGDVVEEDDDAAQPDPVSEPTQAGEAVDPETAAFETGESARVKTDKKPSAAERAAAKADAIQRYGEDIKTLATVEIADMMRAVETAPNFASARVTCNTRMSDAKGFRRRLLPAPDASLRAPARQIAKHFPAALQACFEGDVAGYNKRASKTIDAAKKMGNALDRLGADL